jgi:N-acetylglucosaminyl-diphospho-decaprenol L-rhamnosyltransferase
MSLEVSVLIVNYNTAKEVCAAVKSVLQQQNIRFEVIVIDNASHDDSVKQLQALFAEKIILIENHENSGFGRANNLGAQKAHGEYLFFLNPDANLIDVNALRALYDFMKANPQVGLAGTKLISPHTQKTIKPAYSYPQQHHLKFTQHFANLPGKIAWVQGSSMMMRKDIFTQIHGFDKDYFLYAEEMDLCLRVRQAGFEIGVCEGVTVEHIGGASERFEKIAATRRRKQQGLYLFYQKHYDLRDVNALAKRAMVRSFMKMLWLSVARFISPKNQAMWIRQKVVYQVAREFLALKNK